MKIWLEIILIILYISGNFIPTDGSVKGKNGIVYSKHGGFCLETQQYPDSVNQKTFPSDTVLRPGKLYDHRVTYKFLDFWYTWNVDKKVKLMIFWPCFEIVIKSYS